MNLICGINPVLEALNAGSRHFERLLVAKGVRNRRVGEAIRRASSLGVPLRFEAREILDRMAGGIPHQGLIAVVSPKEVASLDAILAEARTPGLFLLLDGVEDPRNLGAILRTAEATGVDGVLLPERHSAGLSETVAKASAGGLEHVKVARVGNVVQALDALKGRGVWVVGFDASGSERWDRVDYRGPVALVLGGEGRGIRRLVREHCDHLASLPLFGHVTSLNVSVAAGVALYEVVRQRGAEPSHVRPIPAGAYQDRQVIGPAPEDTEGDPGARPQPDEAEAGLEEDTDLSAVVYLDDPEEPDWSGPPVIKAINQRARGAGPQRLGPRRFARRRGQRNEADGATPNAAPAPESGPAGRPVEGGDATRRRKRRRGKRRSEGNDGTPGAPGAPPPAPTESSEARGGSEAARPTGGGRRRRRRRRP